MIENDNPETPYFTLKETAENLQKTIEALKEAGVIWEKENTTGDMNFFYYATLQKPLSPSVIKTMKNIGKAKTKAHALIRLHKMGDILCFIELSEEDYNIMKEDAEKDENVVWNEIEAPARFAKGKDAGKAGLTE